MFWLIHFRDFWNSTWLFWWQSTGTEFQGLRTFSGQSWDPPFQLFLWFGSVIHSLSLVLILSLFLVMQLYYEFFVVIIFVAKKKITSLLLFISLRLTFVSAWLNWIEMWLILENLSILLLKLLFVILTLLTYGEVLHFFLSDQIFSSRQWHIVTDGTRIETCMSCACLIHY